MKIVFSTVRRKISGGIALRAYHASCLGVPFELQIIKRKAGANSLTLSRASFYFHRGMITRRGLICQVSFYPYESHARLHQGEEHDPEPRIWAHQAGRPFR